MGCCFKGEGAILLCTQHDTDTFPAIPMDNWQHLSVPYMHRFGHGQMYVADAVEAHSCMRR